MLQALHCLLAFQHVTISQMLHTVATGAERWQYRHCEAHMITGFTNVTMTGHVPLIQNVAKVRCPGQWDRIGSPAVVAPE